ncbi:MAG: TOBE domain-containing protein [Rhodanobacteraceae bacterium]
MARQRTLDVDGSLFLAVSGRGSLGRKRIVLLERIAVSGSISQAARDVGMSYKAAWDAVDAMDNLAEGPLVARNVGGRHGGGTQLTARGLKLVEVYRAAEAQFEGFLARLGRGVAGFDRFQEVMRRLGMQTSARNELAGKVKKITKGAVNSAVVLDLGGGDELVAIITNASVENLALKRGVAAYALVKASWVILAASANVRTSARNRLCGKVETVHEGTVNSEITLKLAGGKRMTAIVTIESARELGLKPGAHACALVKASHVVLAVLA